MATYNADIRIGVVGKSSLNSLEAQLNRIGKQTKALNNALKIRSQRVKLNTAGAMSQLKRLNTELSKLGRTITVKVKAAGLEEAAKKQSTSIVATAGGGGRSTAAPAAAAAIAVQKAVSTEIIRQTKATENLARLQGLSTRLNAESAKKLEISRNYSEEIAKIRNRINSELTTEDKLQFGLTKNAQKQLDLTKKKLIEQEGYAEGAPALTARLLKEQERLIANDGRRARNENQIADARNRNLRKQLEQTTAVYNKEAAAFASLQDRNLKVARATSENITRVEQEQSAKREEIARREARTRERLQRVRRGRARQSALQGARGGALRGGIASAATIPGISPLALGAGSGAALGGGIAGGVAGAAVAAAVQGTAALVAYGNAAAVAAADTERLQIALGSVVGAEGFEGAVAATERLSDEFNTAIPDVTKEFTRLTAAVKANKGTVEESEGIYKGLAAANAALGGDAEALQGILRATTQVLSKGKVQAEELRGQIGERLPGAFALFADAQKLSLAELDKALEQGKISAKDFVDFAIDLYDKYGEAAKQINDSPAAAGQRLEKNLKNLQVAVGTILAPIGAKFQSVFGAIVEDITAATKALARFLGLGLSNAIAKAEQAVADAKTDLEDVQNRDFGNQQEARQKQALSRAKGALTLAQQNLQVLKDRMKLEEAIDRERQDTTTETALDKDAKRQQEINRGLALEGEFAVKFLELQRRKNELTDFEYEKALLVLETNQEQAEILSTVTDEIEKQRRLFLLQIGYETSLLALEQDRAERMKQVRKDLKDLVNEIANQGLVTEFEKVNDAVAEISPGMQAANQAGSELFRTFENLISATKNWTDVLADALKALSSVLIRFALGSLAGGDGQGLFSFLNGTLSPSTQTSLPGVLSNQTEFTGNLGNVGGGSIGFRARGGRVTGASPYVVGEQGAELFIPGKSGTIVPADVFNATRAAMSGGSEGGDSDAFDQNAVAIGTNSSITKEKAVTREMAMAGSTAVDVRYDATVINDVSYVSEEQFQAGLKAAVAQSKASMFRDLKNKPSARAGIGI